MIPRNSAENNPAYGDTIAVLQGQVETAAADALRLPYSLGNTDEVVAAFEGGGFSDISIETKIEPARFPSSRHIVEAEFRGWLPLFDIFLSEAEINDILVESDRTLSAHANSLGEAIFPTSAHIVTTQKSSTRYLPLACFLSREF